MNTSKKALFAFLDTSIEKGRINRNRAQASRPPVQRYWSNWARMKMFVRLMSLLALIQYNNRHPNELSPDSLRVYESRVRTAISSFTQSVTDPTNFKFPAKSAGSRAAKQVRRPPEETAESKPSHGGAHSSQASPRTVTETSLAMPFPLRPDFLAQIVVPRDLTKEEAKRLAAFL